MMEEKVLINLKKYNKHEERTCLECGYKGLMGVDKYVLPAYLRILVKFVLFLIVLILYGFSGKDIFVMLAVIAIMIPLWLKLDKRYVYCPNCEKLLK